MPKAILAAMKKHSNEGRKPVTRKAIILLRKLLAHFTSAVDTSVQHLSRPCQQPASGSPVLAAIISVTRTVDLPVSQLY
jgi:hypothetical protein